MQRAAAAEGPLLPHPLRQPQTATAQVSEIKHHVEVDTLEQLAGRDLELNEIGVCNLSINKPLVFDPYAREPRDRRLSS